MVKLREDVRTGELSLADFAADLHDVMMQRGARPIYEDPARFFALTYPTFALRERARDVLLRLAGRNTKAVRQLELTYGGGKTHTLVALLRAVDAARPLPADARRSADVRRRVAGRGALGHGAPDRAQRLPAGARPGRHRRGGPRADRHRHARGDREPRPAALQDLVDALPDIVKSAAGVPLEFRLDAALGDGGKDVDADTVASIDDLLREVSPDLRLKP